MGNYPPIVDHLVDPRRFIAQKFILRRTWPNTENDCVASIAGLRAARIVLVALAFSQQRWALHITGPSLIPELRRNGFHYDSLEEAKEVLRIDFDKWLNWALGQGGLVTWWGADSDEALTIAG